MGMFVYNYPKMVRLNFGGGFSLFQGWSRKIFSCARCYTNRPADV
jgi:hypothetical protein